MKGYRTKKIALPGGRVIEIVYFSDPDGDTAPETGTETPQDTSLVGAQLDVTTDDAPASGLHVCDRCGGDLVYPVAWEEREGDRWRIERRCPNCEWRDVDEFHQSEVELFDDVLNEGTEDLLVNLRNFARSNMEEDVERLIEAIHLDLIEPMDF